MSNGNTPDLSRLTGRQLLIWMIAAQLLQTAAVIIPLWIQSARATDAAKAAADDARKNGVVVEKLDKRSRSQAVHLGMPPAEVDPNGGQAE